MVLVSKLVFFGGPSICILFENCGSFQLILGWFGKLVLTTKWLVVLTLNIKVVDLTVSFYYNIICMLLLLYDSYEMSSKDKFVHSS